MLKKKLKSLLGELVSELVDEGVERVATLIVNARASKAASVEPVKPGPNASVQGWARERCPDCGGSVKFQRIAAGVLYRCTNTAGCGWEEERPVQVAANREGISL